MWDYVAEVLVRHGVVGSDRAADAKRVAEDKGRSLIDVLLAMDAAEESAMVQALADEAGVPYLAKIDAAAVPEALLEAVPINFARQHHVLPIGESAQGVKVAIADPLEAYALDDLRALLGRAIEPFAATRETIDDVINKVYERKDEGDLDHKRDEDEDEAIDIIDSTDEAPVIRWVNNLFYTSVRDRASDIHIEPTDDKVIVRYRIDGRLVVKKEAPRGALSSIVARIKIEAGLNIAEKRLPQDGRIAKRIAGKAVDVRVSTIPTAKGERIVMRLLDKENIMLDLVDLGFARRELDQLDHFIRRPNGIILVTGPTGSGKTTTLYASLNRINTPDKNILTVEDPVEYELRGVGQIQIHPKIGLSFASGLRAFLRQDPDVIMVGEIRDHETAEIPIHASLTGHLVLSTLHTNDAPGAVTRMVEMGIAGFQISSSVLAVLAQRLVRRLCPVCREPYTATEEDLIELGIELDTAEETLAELQRVAATTVIGKDSKPPAELFEAEPTRVNVPAAAYESALGHGPLGGAAVGEHGGMPTFYRPKGCEACGMTGYRGRMGIFELMIIDEGVRREILAASDAKTIQRAARAGGMRTLREDGARQVLAGVTSVEEVLAATQASDTIEEAAE